MAKRMTPADFELSWALCPDKVLQIGINPFTKKPYCSKKMAYVVLVDGVEVWKTTRAHWLVQPDVRRLRKLLKALSEQILVRVGCSRQEWPGALI